MFIVAFATNFVFLLLLVDAAKRMVAERLVEGV